MKFWCPKCYHIKDFVNDVPNLLEERECPFCGTEMHELNEHKEEPPMQSKRTSPMWNNRAEFENGVRYFVDRITEMGLSKAWKFEVESLKIAKCRAKLRFEFLEAVKRMNLKFEIND